MKAVPFRLFVLLITSAVTMIVCYLVGLLIHLNIFSGTARGFELFLMGIAMSVVYATARFYPRTIILVVSAILGAGVSYFLMRAQGNAMSLYPTYIVLMILTGLIIDLFWMRPNGIKIKSIPFAIMGAVAYSLTYLIGHVIAGETPKAMVLVGYLEFGLFLYLGFSLAMMVAERIYYPLGIKWNVEGFYYVDDEDDDSEASD